MGFVWFLYVFLKEKPCFGWKAALLVSNRFKTGLFVCIFLGSWGRGNAKLAQWQLRREAHALSASEAATAFQQLISHLFHPKPIERAEGHVAPQRALQAPEQRSGPLISQDVLKEMKNRSERIKRKGEKRRASPCPSRLICSGRAGRC